jgi:hypothetical protein
VNLSEREDGKVMPERMMDLKMMKRIWFRLVVQDGLLWRRRRLTSFFRAGTCPPVIPVEPIL